MVLRKLKQNRDSFKPSNDTNLSVLYVEDDDDATMQQMRADRPS